MLLILLSIASLASFLSLLPESLLRLSLLSTSIALILALIIVRMRGLSGMTHSLGVFTIKHVAFLIIIVFITVVGHLIIFEAFILLLVIFILSGITIELVMATTSFVMIGSLLLLLKVFMYGPYS
jgi:hypothetical protein